MLSTTFLSQIFGVFGTGVLASLSPCVYPIIPITVGFLGSQASEGRTGKRSILMYVLGQSLALMGVGIIAVQLGETLGFSSESPLINSLVGSFLILAGIFSLVGKLPRIFSQWNQGSGSLIQSKAKGPLAAFLLGVGAALLASPCTSPILGGVLAMISNATTATQGMVLMGMYSAGFSLVFLILGLGILKMDKLPRAGKWMIWVHRISAFILFFAGLYYLYTAWSV